MADVSIDSTVVAATARGWRSVVFVTQSVGYCFYLDSDGVFGYSKTTDGGASWGGQVNVDNAAATTVIAFDVWYDKWTPGDQGTLIHCWFFDSTNDDILYRTLDTNGDVLGTQRTVIALTSAVAGVNAYVSGTKTRSGYLYCCSAIDASNEEYFGRSTDAGVTWSATLDAGFQESNPDHALLFPASNTGDDNDIWAIYHDSSVPALTIKMWDSSAASAIESATVQTNIAAGTDLTIYQYPFTGAIRHSDGHLIVISMSDRDTATADMQVYDVSAVNAGSLTGITTLTNITTDKDDIYHPQIFIDQATAAIYVAYNGKRDGTETLGTTTKVYYTKSTDAGANWTANDTAYMEGAAGIVVQVWTPLSGPRFYAGWRVGTTLLGNNVNSVMVSLAVMLTETLHVSETLTQPVLDILLLPMTDETLHLSDVGGGLIHIVGRLHLSDTIVDIQRATADPSTSVTETLRIADTLTQPVLDPLVTSLTEALHVIDTLTQPVLNPLETSLAETLRIADALAQPVLDPLETSFVETLHVIDTLTQPALTGDQTVDLTETLRIADILTQPVLDPLESSLIETLHATDILTQPVLDPLVTSLAEALHIIDTLTQPVLDPLETSLVETLHIADVGLIASEGLTVNQTETLHITDTANFLLFDPNLLTATLTEMLHVSDVGGGLIHVIGRLHLSDTIVDIYEFAGLTINTTETLHITDVVTPLRLPLEAVVVESLHFADAVESYVDRVEIEALHIVETIADIQRIDVANDLSVPNLTETLHIAEALTPALQLSAELSETLHLAETATVALQLSASITEALHLAETATVALQLASSLAEALHIVDVLTPQMDLAPALLTETLHISESITNIVRVEAADLIANPSEALKVTESVTTRIEPLFLQVVDEMLHLSEAVSEALTPLFLTLSEALHLTEVVTAGFGLAVQTTETLKIADAITVTRDIETSQSEAVAISETIATGLDQSVEAQEALRVVDAPVEALYPLLEVTLNETLHVVDTFHGGVDLLTAVLSEDLNIFDFWFVRRGNAGVLDVVGTYTTVINVVGSYVTSIDIVGEGAK